MSLHMYMLPEVVPSTPPLKVVNECDLPSRLFVGVDPRSKAVLLSEGLYESDASDQANTAMDDGYKHWRRQYALQEPFSQLQDVYYTDFEDARYIPREALFGFDFNVFQYNRRRGDRTSALWTLPNYYEPSRGIGRPPRGIKKDSIEFSDKIAKILWRGGISGTRWPNPFERYGVPPLTADKLYDLSLARDFSRFKLVLSTAQSEIVDAKFAGNTVELFTGAQSLNNQFFSDAVHANDMMEYRYILCPAGNDVSTSLYWVLQTNSIAFKEETEYETIPDYFLKPWVHYIPVSPGLDDIEEKFEYCENNPGFCARLLENAHQAFEAIVDPPTWDQAKMDVLDRLGLLDSTTG